jgi:hypothetical protein
LHRFFENLGGEKVKTFYMYKNFTIVTACDFNNTVYEVSIIKDNTTYTSCKKEDIEKTLQFIKESKKNN